MVWQDDVAFPLWKCELYVASYIRSKILELSSKDQEKHTANSEHLPGGSIVIGRYHTPIKS